MKSMLLVGGVCLIVAGVALGQATEPATSSTSPSAEQMLNQMLRSPQDQGRPLRPATGGATDTTSGPGATAPKAPPVTVLREGTTLVDRVGRLVRSADGQQWEFVFASDGQAMQDPPVILVPNLLLMSMEEAASTMKRDLRFRVTGDVTEYRGRNYLILRKAVVVPDAQQQF